MAQAAARVLVLAMRLRRLDLGGASWGSGGGLELRPESGRCRRSVPGCPWADLQPLPAAETLLSSWQQQLDQPQPSAAIEAQVRSAAQHRRCAQPATP